MNELLGVTELMARRALLVPARLDECREFVERHPPADFVVGWRDPRRQVVVDGEHIRDAEPGSRLSCGPNARFDALSSR
ncbi:MAG: hypothetical protein ACREQK_03075 [Candidatus Binatia bacterium]